MWVCDGFIHNQTSTQRKKKYVTCEYMYTRLYKFSQKMIFDSIQRLT